MELKDLTPEEIHQRVTKELSNTIIRIARANSDFVCTECLRTLGALKNILGYLDTQVWEETVAEVDNILNGEY